MDRAGDPSPSGEDRSTTRKSLRPSQRLATIDRHRDRLPSAWLTALSLIVVDAVAIVLLFAATDAIVGGTGGDPVWLQTPTRVGLGAALLVAFAVAGLYRRRFVHPVIEMRGTAIATALVGGAAALVVLLVGASPATATFFAVVGGLGSIVLPTVRTFTRVVSARMSWWGLPAVIVGSRHRGGAVRDTLDTWPEIGLRPVASLIENRGLDDRGQVAEVTKWVDHLADTFGGEVAIIAMPTLSHVKEAAVVNEFTDAFRHVVVMPDKADAPAQWTTEPAGYGLYGRSVWGRKGRRVGSFVKRVVDLLGSGVLLILCAPVFAAIAVLVRWGSEGPVLYTQQRMGTGGESFTALKFRTMYQDADRVLSDVLARSPQRREEYEQFHKLENDPRITSIGRILRRFSLDELPQLINVLRGDMSLVGPRPYMVAERSKMEGLDHIILQVRPGLTGLWQVSGRNDLSFAERIRLDVHYIQNWSPWLDVYIVVRTLPAVLTGEGAT